MTRATLATTAWWMCFRILLFLQISIAIPSLLWHGGVGMLLLGGLYNGNLGLKGLYWMSTFWSVAVVSGWVARLLALQLSTGWRHDTAASDLMREKWKSGLVTGVWFWCMTTAVIALKGKERWWATKVIGVSVLVPWYVCN
jgi:hypothetical protein